MEQSLQIGGVWSFYKAMSDRAERCRFVKCSGGRDFLQSCCPPAPTFDKYWPVPDNTEYLLNKELDI